MTIVAVWVTPIGLGATLRKAYVLNSTALAIGRNVMRVVAIVNTRTKEIAVTFALFFENFIYSLFSF